MPTPTDALDQVKRGILLALALNRSRTWFSPAELMTSCRVQRGAEERWESAVQALIAEGALATARLVMGGIQVPMIRATETAALPLDEAAKQLRSRWHRWEPDAFLGGQRPLIRIPADDELAIPPPPAAETASVPA